MSPRLLGLALLACMLGCPPACAGATVREFTPRFDPYYRPDPSTDEGGFWYQMDKAEKDVRQSPQRLADPELDAYVNGIACRLAGEFCNSVRVYLVRNPNFNASMAPNGMMVVWTGLLLRTANEAQLAAVIGHEIAHFLLAHQITQWRRVRSTMTGAMVADILLAGVTGVYGLATLGAAGGVFSFSREQESEADLYGLQLLVRAGYSPGQAAALWRYVIEESEHDLSKTKYNAFLASHPRSADRERVLNDAAEAYSGRAGLRTDAEALVDQLAHHYAELMGDHEQMREFEQMDLLLQRHRAMGLPEGQVAYFEGELHRLRKGPGDVESAEAAYRQALRAGSAPPSCYRELGYLLAKRRDPEAASLLRSYLEQEPGAGDREMVRFLIDSLPANTTESP